MTHFFVPHRVFRWLMLRICLATLAMLTFLGVCVAFYFDRALASYQAVDPGVGASAPVLLTLVLVTAGVASVATLAAFFLHRVTGPIYRLERHLNSIIQGEPIDEFKIRQGDQMHELCDLYNQMLQSQDIIEPKSEPRAW